MFDTNLLKNEEKAVFSLRSLYGRYGYKSYKMGKFEEYELYSRNRDFLVSENIIVFNDTDGRLLALKPDVTLSIIKNSKDETGCVQKLYYNENVYRVSPRTHTFKEIMQTGLECIGDIDIYNVIEVISLAAESLSVISPEFVLDVSHMGILSAIVDSLTADKELKKQIVAFAAQKNAHDIKALCRENSIDDEECGRLCDFIGIYGEMGSVIERLDKICRDAKSKEAYEELKFIYSLLKGTAFEKNIHFDFSIANDMNYYNGIVFQGFIEGIPDSVLSGGQYDMLMHKMGRKSGAIGFAVYLDVLEQLSCHTAEYDVDMLILYDDKTDLKELMKKVNDMTQNGTSVTAQKQIPSKLRYRHILNLSGKGRENND